MVIRPPRPPDEPDIGDHYDELDPFYRELWGDHVHRGLWEDEEDGGRLASLATAEEHLRWCRQAGFRRVAPDDLSDRVRRTWDVILRRTLMSLRRGATWSYLLDPWSRHRRFGLTLGWIWVAYRLGALRYHLLTALRDGR